MDFAVTAEGRAPHEEDNAGGGDGTNGSLNGGQISGGPESHVHAAEDNKFQRAISVWRGGRNSIEDSWVGDRVKLTYSSQALI